MVQPEGLGSLSSTVARGWGAVGTPNFTQQSLPHQYTHLRPATGSQGLWHVRDV